MPDTITTEIATLEHPRFQRTGEPHPTPSSNRFRNKKGQLLERNRDLSKVLITVSQHP
ncbi:hypothetical protein EKPV-NSW-ORF179 [Eastern grey kangaroopox virus]|uniref:Uncharacterized protein n=1 Tax=Eastern grey kangaroopox virus TaxID=2042482 RepID=A0A345Z0S1_9POXV|nr:hypothetical protein EKPV-NSW-ORF179 [Eastern grey kangaroopox virus]